MGQYRESVLKWCQSDVSMAKEYIWEGFGCSKGVMHVSAELLSTSRKERMKSLRHSGKQEGESYTLLSYDSPVYELSPLA